MSAGLIDRRSSGAAAGGAPPPPPPSKALDTSVRKLSRILCEDVRVAGTRNDDRLDAQDPTCRRLLPLWPDLVVSRARNVHVVDLRQRFQRTDFIEPTMI